MQTPSTAKSTHATGSLIAALLCLAIWVIFAFVRPFGLGVVHLFWAVSVVLFIRYWALRHPLRGIHS